MPAEHSAPGELDATARRPRLSEQGLVLDGEIVPLFAGSVHYFRLAPDAWRPALLAVRELGLCAVDTYVPWGVHEIAPGQYDFGERRPELALTRFLELAHELGLYAIVRPGPHVNAELTYFGIPERVIWSSECQARSASGAPVALPVPPLAFPVPSYAAEAFLREACHWLYAVGRRLAPLCHPTGPIVLCQVDNEGALYFRDGVYDQDYHPDALRLYHGFLEQKYGDVARLGTALGSSVDGFALAPPRRFDGRSVRELCRHLDWAEAQELLLERALERLRGALELAGVRVPFSHNLPIGEALTPLDPGRVGRAVELVGLDYYHGAGPRQRADIARRTSELAVRARARAMPAFGCEIGLGFPPFFPPLGEADAFFVALSALAYGLRAFNLYMAVGRDRWIGAPYDADGRARPSAARWQKLCRALEALRFHELSRDTFVHLLVPRGVRRLCRVLHAFGPLSPSLFQLAAGGVADGVLEDPLDAGAPLALETERFLGCVERELERLRIPFAYSASDLSEASLSEARWTVVACAGGLETPLFHALRRAREQGRPVTLGPRLPVYDATFVPRDEDAARRQEGDAAATPWLLELDERRIARAVERAAERLELGALSASPAALEIALHRDASGCPRVLFAINPTNDAIDARLGACGALRAEDVLDDTTIHANVDTFELVVPPLSVRLLALAF